MSDEIIRKSLETRLNAVSSGVIPTAFENVAFVPIKGTPYQRAHILPAKTQNPTMGDGFRREAGIFQVTLFFPANAGAWPATARAKVVKDQFARGLTISESNVRVMIDESPYQAPGETIDDWYILPVSIPYIADVQ